MYTGNLISPKKQMSVSHISFIVGFTILLCHEVKRNQIYPHKRI